MHLAWTHKPAHLASKPVHLANKKLLAKILRKDLPGLGELAQWIEAFLGGDDNVTKREIRKAIKALNGPYGFPLTTKEWKLLRASFDYADINDDGKVTGDELACVIENVSCK